MSVTDGWTERKPGDDGESRTPKAGVRSLKTALFEAGLGEYPQDPPGTARRKAAEAALESAHQALVREPIALPRIARPETAEPTSVVSPPPWLRDARRGRRQSQLQNAFGWLMTLVIAGSIIGLAGHLLTGGPTLQSFQSARQ